MNKFGFFVDGVLVSMTLATVISMVIVIVLHC